MDIMRALSDIVSSIESGELQHYSEEHREIYNIALDQASENLRGSKKWRKKLENRYDLGFQEPEPQYDDGEQLVEED